jgi:hypothetical protein
MVLVSRAGPAATAFYAFMQRAAGVGAVLTRFGFALPEGK